MSFSEKLKAARITKGLTQEEVARKIGIAKSTYCGYETGKREPDVDKIKKLAYVLGTTGDILLETNMKPAVDHLHISTAALKIARSYDSLDAHGKKVVSVVMNAEVERISVPKSITRFIDLFALPVSAGTGEPLTGYDSEPVEVISTIESERADYALRVSGNSMEPNFSDGDIVLVETTPDVEQNSVGVFVHDGQGYIKRLVGGQLISDNPDYSPIQADETTRIKGRILGKAELA